MTTLDDMVCEYKKNGRLVRERPLKWGAHAYAPCGGISAIADGTPIPAQ